MTRRLTVAGMIIGAMLGALAGPAAAHVSIDPPSVPKGSSVKLSFLVPNERAAARTTKVQIVFPEAPNVIPGVTVEAKPGWTFVAVKQSLAEPIVTDDGTIDEVVRSVTWTANNAASGLGPDEFGEFTVNADGIPDATDELVFKAVQSYSDGSIERWVDPVTPGGPEAERPTPILALTDPAGSGGDDGTGNEPTTSTTSAPPVTSETTTISTSTTQDDSARALGAIGIALGAAGLLIATGAFMRRRRA